MAPSTSAPNYGVCGKCHERCPPPTSSEATRSISEVLPAMRDERGARQQRRGDLATQARDLAVRPRHGHREDVPPQLRRLHAPAQAAMVFVDLTNRCNMNCPICVANVPWMGFDYYPPLAYFQKVFKGLAAWDPPPVIHLFGGEPTMRDDLLEIIDYAHGLGLRVHLVTNGLKLADKADSKAIATGRCPSSSASTP